MAGEFVAEDGDAVEGSAAAEVEFYFFGGSGVFDLADMGEGGL